MTANEERTWNNINVDEEHRKILRIKVTSETYQSLDGEPMPEATEGTAIASDTLMFSVQLSVSCLSIKQSQQLTFKIPHSHPTHKKSGGSGKGPHD